MSTTNAHSKDESTASLMPCSSAGDLYLPAARATLARLLSAWLNHHCLTITEFIHSASALEKFEAAGMHYQHAVQRAAQALAAKSHTPVVQFIRDLTQLTTAAINRVDQDERSGLFVRTTAEALAEMAEHRTGNANARYILNGSLAKHLAPAKSWNDKLLHVLSLREHAPKSPHSRPFFLSVIDTIVSEIMGNAVALKELLGAGLDTSQRLTTAIRLVRGDTGEDMTWLSDGLRWVGLHFANDELADARHAIASFILSECKSSSRLCPSSYAGELKAFRQMADQLSVIGGGYLNLDDLKLALVERSKRLVTQEALVQITADAQNPDEKVECLLTIAESIEGDANKRSLGPFVLAVLTAHNLSETFAAGTPGIQRIKRAADLQRRIQRSGFADGPRDKMVECLDEIAAHIEAKGGFIDGLTTRMPDPAERADTYLRMFATSMFTEGKLAKKARQALLAALAAPDFLPRYCANTGMDRTTLIADLTARVGRAGIPPRDCLQALGSKGG